MIEDALRHALAAGDEAYAVDLVETHFALMANQQIPERVLAQWLGLFAEQTISRQPGLLIVQATAWVTATQYARAAPLLPRIAAFLQDDRHLEGDRRRMFQGHFDLLQGIVLYWQNDLPGAGVHLRAALDNLPPAHESPAPRRTSTWPGSIRPAAGGRQALRCWRRRWRKPRPTLAPCASSCWVR